jgi:hypothetical protein
MTDDARKPEKIEEQVLESPQAESPADTPEESATARNKGSFISRWGWVFILLIAVGVGLLLTPADVRQKWFANGIETVQSSIPQISEPAPDTASAPEASPTEKPAPAQQTPARQPEAQAAPEAAVSEPASTAPVSESAPVTHPAPVQRPTITVIKREGINEDEARKLLDAMNTLQQDLATLRNEQQDLRQTQTDLQRIQLRTRLGWIANPVNHLPQIELAWEEITRMPTLSSDEREKAQAMYSLAQQRHADIVRWQQALNEAAARLRPEEHPNIIPQFEQPWLKRLFGQFSLKRAPEAEAQQMQQLRQQLQGTARQLQQEQWPDPVAWQKLRAHVQLALAELPGSTIDNMPKLPDSFSDIARDIGKLRQAAQTWQEQL